MIGHYDDPETWRGAARSTLRWTADRYDQLAEIAERFRGPGKLLQ
jgi:hypothetical protein